MVMPIHQMTPKPTTGASQLAAEDHAGALETFERCESVYREAMGDASDELEAWRAGVRAEALRCLGRLEEAIELAERSVEVAARRELLWSLPLSYLALARVLADADRPGAMEALEKGAEVARGTGARVSLDSIEEARGEIVASATRSQ